MHATCTAEQKDIMLALKRRLTYTDPPPNSLLTICKPEPMVVPTRVMPELVVPVAAVAPWQHSKPFVHTLFDGAVKIARPEVMLLSCGALVLVVVCCFCFFVWLFVCVACCCAVVVVVVVVVVVA